MAQNTTRKRAKPNSTGIFGRCNHDLDREGTRSSWEEELKNILSNRRETTKEELRVDMRERSPELQEFYNRQDQLTFKLNHTMPRTEEYFEVLNELFGDRLGEGSYIRTPISGAALENLVVGKN